MPGNDEALKGSVQSPQLTHTDRSIWSTVSSPFSSGKWEVIFSIISLQLKRSLEFASRITCDVGSLPQSSGANFTDCLTNSAGLPVGVGETCQAIWQIWSAWSGKILLVRIVMPQKSKVPIENCSSFGHKFPTSLVILKPKGEVDLDPIPRNLCTCWPFTHWLRSLYQDHNDHAPYLRRSTMIQVGECVT